MSFSKYALFAARTRFMTLFLCFFIVFKLLFLFEFVTSFHCFNNIGGQPLGECRVFNSLPPKWGVFFYDRKKGLIPGWQRFGWVWDTNHCRKWCRVEILKKVTLIKMFKRTLLNSCVAFGQLSSSFTRPCADHWTVITYTDIRDLYFWYHLFVIRVNMI